VKKEYKAKAEGYGSLVMVGSLLFGMGCFVLPYLGLLAFFCFSFCSYWDNFVYSRYCRIRLLWG